MTAPSVYESYTRRTARLLPVCDLKDADDVASLYIRDLIGFLFVCRCRRVYHFFRRNVLRIKDWFVWIGRLIHLLFLRFLDFMVARKTLAVSSGLAWGIVTVQAVFIYTLLKALSS